MRLRSSVVSERVVLVTGALAGIGRATAAAFAREGSSVVVSGRRDEEGQAFAAELRELGAKAEYIRADVSIEHNVRALADGTVNNAAITGLPG
jgi:NAD(P)-dependent dehydrogenase (short-subunit alcohol dehydrogenase family)